MRGKRVAVGLSGGLDSVVLLHLMHDRALESRADRRGRGLGRGVQVL